MALPQPESFLSGETGHVAGIRRTIARRMGDSLLDAWLRVGRVPERLDELAACAPARNVLVLSAYRPDSGLIAPAVAELRRTRHALRIMLGSTGAAQPGLEAETAATGLPGGKFQNLNATLAAGAPRGGGAADWTLVVDDDVELPPRFVDRLIGLCEALSLTLAQPAQTLMSHAAWRVTRRRPRSLVRETRFVEIGPVTAFSREAATELLPFPDLRYGWGLDLHWAAVAAERGWRLGVADALPVRHELTRVAASYPPRDAIREAQHFLAGRPYLRAALAQETLATRRRLP